MVNFKKIENYFLTEIDKVIIGHFHEQQQKYNFEMYYV